jgi:hypothetical protein
LNRSALHQNGEIIDRCNHWRFEEDDQSNGDSTAAFRIYPMKCGKQCFLDDRAL